MSSLTTIMLSVAIGERTLLHGVSLRLAKGFAPRA